MKIKKKAFCVFFSSKKVLLGITNTGNIRYRAIGGNLKHREFVETALYREIKEELKQDIKNIVYLNTIEHCSHHTKEINFIYKADFKNPEIYFKSEIKYIESDGKEYLAKWINISDILEQDDILPIGIKEIMVNYQASL